MTNLAFKDGDEFDIEPTVMESFTVERVVNGYTLRVTYQDEFESLTVFQDKDAAEMMNNIKELLGL